MRVVVRTALTAGLSFAIALAGAASPSAAAPVRSHHRQAVGGAPDSGAPTAGDETMPAGLYLAVARSRAAEADPAYHVDRHGRGANPRHGLDLAFTAGGARVDGRAGGFALRLARFGRGDGEPVRQTAPRIDGAWVEYQRDRGLSEWFVNLPDGVEQGWTVTERPAVRGPLVLELDTARPPDRVGDGRLAWSGLVYHRLVAVDAAGRELPAAWTPDGARLRIEVEDRDAAYPVLIDPWVEQAKLTADDGVAGDDFGISVALSGDTALVGAYLANVDGNGDQGAAYVFTRSGGEWSQQAKLTADDGAQVDQFGFSVALSGDTALVGAYSADVDGNLGQGAAYVFTRSGGVWSPQAKLTADDGAGFDAFGISVALSGDTALVGAYFADVDGNPDQGAAYVFTRSGGVWSPQAKLTADNGAPVDQFGVSVALSEDTALVGAYFAAVDGNILQGAAYVFTRSGGEWSQQDKLIADDGAANDLFSISVALSGGTALVGAWGAAVDGNSAQGAAYVFTHSGGEWSQQAKLTADDGAEGDFFGRAVALSGDTALVGAFEADVDGNSAQGAAYVFTHSGGEWSQQTKLTADDGAQSDQFGFSVALSGDTALVGAYFAAVDGNTAQGAAYVYGPSLVPAALVVDGTPIVSDGNQVFEPGEQVEIAPAWQNDGQFPQLLTGTASDFTGPAGSTYELIVDAADYGEIEPGASASCDVAEMCYQMGIGPPGVPRPALHWDAAFTETLSDATVQTWTLHVGDSFVDVPRSSPFYPAIETLLHHAVTGGCTATTYCPAGPNTRAQMPVFLLKALEGGSYVPPACIEGE
ncbi:MAG: hypothetical protein ACRD2Z_07870, partial [Thermoanaerobaculia bacterium]